MPASLKDFFDRRRVQAIGAQLAGAWPGFPRDRFVREATAGLTGLELMDRGRHIMAAMARALPPAYPDALAIVVRTPDIPRPAGADDAMAPFHYLPHVLFVGEHGIEDVDRSLAAQRILTRHFSCEFTIRPFLERHPARTLAELTRWVGDADEHVRRLVSEGTRPRLPWASRLRVFAADPAPILALLERLKDDPSEYVRRSVANHLNDLAKDQPDLTLATCARWLDRAPPARVKLVTHALRTLVKAGHPEAIRLLGGDRGARLDAHGTVAPAEVHIGGSVQLVVTVRNPGRTAARAVLGARVHFVKARGDTAGKTFKLPTLELAPGATATVRKTISLRQHTTRTHYPGSHAVELVVNGVARPLGRFELRDGARGRGRA